MKRKLSAARVLVLAAILVSMAQAEMVAGQQARPAQDTTSEHRAATQDINLPPEMRSRLAIERAEDEHRKFMEDVRKLDEMSSEVTSSYRENKRLSSDDLKKLSTIEKLARRILTHAGGSEVGDNDLKKLSTAAAIERMSVAAAAIKTNLMAETRHVMSASVIGNSNEIINLAQSIRRAKK
jgi:hypothetical protein